MNPLIRAQERALLGIAIFGLLAPNGVFLYYLVSDPGAVHAATTNPIALVFIAEALLLMFVFAWLIRISGFSAPGWLAFVVMSLVGSMLFSVPAFLYLTSRNARRAAGQ